MNCWKCKKDMGENKYLLSGIEVNVPGELGSKEHYTPEQIAYNNLQLGKYSDGKGGCHVAICYECYIDGLFK